MKSILLGLSVLATTCVPDVRLYCRDARDCMVDADPRESICAYDGSTGMYCAFTDRNCPSGFRYWRVGSGPNNNKCVDPQYVPKDGGTD
jgi:hypothetical protein